MRRGTIGIAGALLLAACGGGVGREEYPAEVAGTLCDIYEECAPAFADASCAAELDGIVRYGAQAQLVALEERGTVRYDAAAAQRCVEESRALGCAILIAGQVEACRDTYVGTVELGGACGLDEECAGDAYCENAECPTTTGTCAALKAAGAECSSTSECTGDLVCEGGVCGVSQSRSGGTCGGAGGLGCPLDELCILAADGATGTCRAIRDLQTAGVGQPCDARDYSVLCQSGLSCVITALDGFDPVAECRDAAAAGGPCFAGVPSHCPEDFYCDADLGMERFEGVCRPEPGEGEPCAEGTAVDACLPGLQCAGGVCRTVKPNGETCSDAAECHSGICAAGACAAPPICG